MSGPITEPGARGAEGPPSERTRLHRHAERGAYARDEVVAVVDEALVCHLGVSTPQGPLVLPMAHGRVGDTLYLHGALANGVLGAATAGDVCVTFTLVDGLVLARTAYHNSVNFRSAVVRGPARRVEGQEKLVALQAVSDHVVPTWDDGRAVADGEVRATLVVAVDLAEASVKARSGGPVDQPGDLGGPWWAGVVPVETRFGRPVPAADLVAGDGVPDRLRALAGRRATGARARR
jgi:nitroimidazol reductase NimA-like FMN-containing flavoprotein (pyridoxamine 5'-phosphate oxidase superfamily)